MHNQRNAGRQPRETRQFGLRNWLPRGSHVDFPSRYAEPLECLPHDAGTLAYAGRGRMLAGDGETGTRRRRIARDGRCDESGPAREQVRRARAGKSCQPLCSGERPSVPDRLIGAKPNTVMCRQQMIGIMQDAMPACEGVLVRPGGRYCNERL